ncbi:MAG: hypothetical protein RL226_1031 [Bacteroidota bacterium]|jgi:FtsH-binding integral membrane protein
MNKKAITYGAIAGVVTAVLYLLFYLIDKGLMANWWLGLIMFPIPIVAMVMANKAIRNEQGFLTFGNGFLNALVAGITYSLVAVLFQILLYNVIDPTLPEYLTEKSIEKTAEFMQKFGMPEEQMEIAMAEAAKGIQDAFSTTQMLLSVLWSAFIWAIIGLIVGLIMKRDKVESNALDV